MFTVRVKLSSGNYVVYRFNYAHEAYVKYCELVEDYANVDCFIGYCRILWSENYEESEPLAD